MAIESISIPWKPNTDQLRTKELYLFIWFKELSLCPHGNTFQCYVFATNNKPLAIVLVWHVSYDNIIIFVLFVRSRFENTNFFKVYAVNTLSCIILFFRSHLTRVALSKHDKYVYDLFRLHKIIKYNRLLLLLQILWHVYNATVFAITIILFLCFVSRITHFPFLPVK